jgi:hypothetical protein
MAMCRYPDMVIEDKFPLPGWKGVRGRVAVRK